MNTAPSSFDARHNINKLKTENARIWRTMNSLKSTSSRHFGSDDENLDDESDVDVGYGIHGTPKIKSTSKHQSPLSPPNGRLFERTSFMNLPNKHKRSSDEYDVRNTSYNGLATADHDIDQRRENVSKHNNRYTQDNGYSPSKYKQSNIENIMKRYSTDNQPTVENITTPYRRNSLTNSMLNYDNLLFLKFTPQF